MKSIISSIIARKMTIGIAILLVGIATFGITAFGMTDKTYAAESTLSLSVSSPTVQADATPINANGTFSKATTSTITASTNNATGYTLSIAAPSNAGSDYNKLIHATDSTAKLNSISSPTTEEQYKALNATSYNNTWGYLPSKYCSDGTSSSCSTNTSFLPAPTTTGDILDQTTSTNSTANTYTIGMGTRIDSTTKIGNYTNSFVVRLVANAIPYSIIYDDNVVSNMPTDVDATTPSSTINIASNTPVRTGFRFLGWCTVVPTNNNGTDACTGGTTYQPSATLTIDQTGTGNNFHLYAMWQLITQSSCPASPMISTVASGITYMQDINSGNKSTVLSALTQDATYQIKDNRDNETYCVGKLADGNLWLLDNLALDLTSSTVLNGMNESNTNASSTTLGYLKNGGGTTSDKYAITGVVNWTDSPTYASGYSYSDPLVNLTYKDVIPSDATSQAGQYKVGGYYNYCAASAGSYCYGNGASQGTSSGDAAEDICPKGWRMPTGNSGEYQTLYSNRKYNTYDKYLEALRLPLSGYLGNGSVRYQGSFGFWWSSTRYGSNTMYTLDAIPSSIYPASHGDCNIGNSVRCVLGS